MRVLSIRAACIALLFSVLAVIPPAAWAALPTPNQPILLVQNSASADPYQNYVPELLTTEGLNGFQVAQLPELTSAFLASYDLVILPHLTLTSTQATLFQNYVNAGGTLVGFRPDLQLANVFGVAPLGTTLPEGWLKIDTSTAYGSALDGQVMKFHGTADLYSLNGAGALASLYDDPNSPTASPAAAIYTFGQGKSILFSFDLAQSIVLMRQGNPAWAGYPNGHDGFSTMRAGQMFMDRNSAQFWNDRSDASLSDVPQADIQLRLFGNALILSNAAKRPLPRLWYFPNQGRAMLLMTGDQHGDPDANSIAEINAVQSSGGKFSEFLWYPFGSISNSQVNSWLAAGHAFGIHFDDTAETDASGAGGSAASWTGMQTVITSALSSFAATFPTAPAPVTTRDHFLIWLSRNAAGAPDQTAQAKLFQNAGIELDTSFSAFPNRWGYMTGSGLPMKFLDTATGAVIPVYEQATQYEDDVQLAAAAYSPNWNLSTAQSHYERTLSDSLTRYNTVVTMLFHPDTWSSFQSYAQTVLQYAQSNSIPMSSTTAWLQFWKGRAATGLSMPSFASNTLTFTATAAPAGLTLLVPHASGNNKVVSAFRVDGVTQSFTVAAYQGVTYAGVVLTAGTHAVSVTYTTAGRIMGQISPSAVAASGTVHVQGGSINQSVSVASDGTYTVGPLPAGTYAVSPSSSSYTFAPASRSVTLGSADVTGINFVANATGQTLFTTQTPGIVNASDGPGANYELGTAFTSTAPGRITAVRFWKGSNETGTHTGNIWSSTGQLLASVTFANESGSGWQQQDLSGPLPIDADTVYVVSVNTGNTYYVATNSGLAVQVANGNLRSVADNNGRFGSAGAFPTSSHLSTNYFRDISFVATPSSTLASLSLNPSQVAGGASSTGTVTLTNPAPAGGAVVTLLSDNSAAAVPASVTVAAGATTAAFTVSTTAVGSATSANIFGNYNGFQSAALAITPPAIASLSLNPSTVTGGASSTATVTLTNPAPAGGAVVTLTSNSGGAAVPASVTVAAGATTAAFTVSTTAVGSATSASISGNYNGSQSAVLRINAPALASLSFNPASVTGGASSTGTVTLTSPAPSGGAVVTLSDNSSSASTPVSVTIPQGASGATFTVTTSSVSSAATVSVTATYGGTTQSATLTVNPAASSGGSGGLLGGLLKGVFKLLGF